MDIPILATLGDSHVGGMHNGVTSVAFHPTANPPLLATGSRDKTVTMWLLSSDNTSAACVATLVGHSDCVTSVAFHPTANQPLLASSSRDKTVKLWRHLSPDNTSCVATLEGHVGHVNSVAFHPTEPLLATGSSDSTVKLWLMSSDNSSAVCVATLEGHSRAVNSVAFHPTAPLLATGSGDATVKLWRISDKSATCVGGLSLLASPGNSDYTRAVTSVAFHPTAPLLATGSADHTVRLWRLSDNMSDNKCVAILNKRKMGHVNHVTSVAFHPTAPILVTGSWDKTVKMWLLSKDNSSVTYVETLVHSGHVTSVAFHPTAPLLATGSGDSITKVWDCMQLTDPWQRMHGMRAFGAMRNFLITKLGTDPSVHPVSQQLALENYSKRLSDATATNSLKLGPVADRLHSLQEFHQNKRTKYDGGSRRRKIKAKPKSVKRKRK